MLVVRRLRLIALALVLSLLVASCAGGGDSPGEADGSSGNSSSSSTAAKDLPPAEIKVNPAKGTKGVMPDDEINVQVMRGTLTDVQVTGAGRAVEGEIDGQSWTSTQRLAPDTTYTVAVTADGPEPAQDLPGLSEQDAPGVAAAAHEPSSGAASAATASPGSAGPARRAVLMLLLVAAVGYGVKLERKLTALRAGQLAFASAVTELNSAASRAEAALTQARAQVDVAESRLAERLTEHAGGARIYLKREDQNFTGAHKINNCLAQALLARRMGKKKVIAETAKHCRPDAVIATNTSSLSVTEMAEAHPHPENFVGMHWLCSESSV